jgi:hypothetical protein
MSFPFTRVPFSVVHESKFVRAVQLEVVRFLVEQRGVEINQQAIKTGWTPLMRCAQMAHYTNQPYMQANPRSYSPAICC